MGTQDFNDLFMRETAPSTRSYFKVVGVGHYGSTIVSIMSMAGISGVDFAIVENNPIPMKCRMIDDNNIVDSNDPECEEKVCEIVGGDTMMLFVVSGMDEDRCVPIMTSLCRQIHSYGDDNDNIVSLALVSIPSSGGKVDAKVQDRLSAIAQNATKVITFYREDEPCIQRMELNEDEQQIIDAINTICQLFQNHNFCFVDYNDVATILQSGTKAVFGAGTGCGEKRVAKAASELIRDLEFDGNMIEDAKGILLHIHFSPSHHLTFEECNTVIDILHHHMSKESNVLYNFSDDMRGDRDTILLNAIVIY